jgi:hypothetical protein
MKMKFGEIDCKDVRWIALAPIVFGISSAGASSSATRMLFKLQTV